MNTAALIGSLVVFALIGQYAKLGLMEWGLFGLLGLAAMTLYAISGRAYAGMLGILSTGTFVLLGHWALSGDVPVKDLLMVFAWIGLLYTVFPAIMMVRTSDPRLWCSIKCGAVFALYVIAYFTLTAAPYDMLERDSTFWSLLALPLCALSVYMVMVIRQHYTADEYIQDYLVAIYALCATAFLSISMAIMLPEAWLPLAFAMQALATVFIFTRTEIDFLQKITLGLIAVFIYVSLPQLGDVFELAVVDRFRAEGRILDNLRVDNFLTYFGLAALLFLASCLLILRKETVYPALQFSLFAAFALLSMSWIYIAGHEMFPQQRGYDFLSSGVISLGFMALGAGLYYAERFTGTAIFTRFSLPIMHLGAVRFAIFCGFLYNPVLGTEHVGALPIINGISVLFGGMLVLSIMAARFLRTGNAAYLYMVFAFFAGLALITFNIRHMFHGDILYGNVPQNAELYTYSAAWLLAGIALLAGGIVWQNKAARFASLGFMVLTILKVFLMDAGSLEGLLRVFSFLGLGVSLLGLSYIYTRFVLNDREHA